MIGVGKIQFGDFSRWENGMPSSMMYFSDDYRICSLDYLSMGMVGAIMYDSIGRVYESDSTNYLQDGVEEGLGHKIACIGDRSDHGGTIITHNQVDGKLTAMDELVAVEQALHSCPIPYHGVTPISPITVKSYHNGRLILTRGAIAGCGALIRPIKNRRTYVE